MAAATLRHAMVLAAGLGTRLRPLTDELPKPAVPVLNRPLAAFTFDHLLQHGVHTIALNTHHLPNQLRAALEPEIPRGVSSLFVHEPQILGTGGGIRQVWRALGEPDPLVVLNGDVLFAPDLVGALAHHLAHDAVATMVLREVPDADRYGAVEIDTTGRVRRLLGAPEVELPLRKLMFTGVQILSAQALATLPERGCVVRQGYRAWVDAGRVVAGFVDAAPWLELGTPADYATAQLGVLSGLGEALTSGRSLVHATAQIDPGATVVDSILGAGCEVVGGVRLERVIAWPGALVSSDLRDTIVTTTGQHVTW